MINRTAIIDTATNKVVNITILEDGSDWTPGEGKTTVVSDVAQIGWVYDGVNFTDPNAPTLEDIAKKVRGQRDNLLTASDWTQVADAPVDQAAWATYRQALRDIPQQAGFPESVMWPTKPE